ncbi:MFS general substrate transporter [Mycena capillaripes]|nr:MFS general substrate transporter [Mycena capillaripes]
MDEDTETTPLLPGPESTPQTPTPLQKVQLGVIMFVQTCEPTASNSIYPYINQLVSELDITGGDERKVGYYACNQESLFFVTEAATVLQWSRASDHVGRKPILLIGLFGTALSMLCFGMSRTFWALVVSRCLTGLLNGNVGVMKSIMGDLTDRSNRAQVMAYMPIVWDVGAAFGFLIGGQLARPQDRFPSLFSGQFWRDYPYLLPSLATAGLVLFSGLVVLLVFKETAPSKKPRTNVDRQESDSPAPSLSPSGPLPLRQLLTVPVITSVSNYIALAFLDISIRALVPLFFATPIAIGGLGLPPAKIGLLLATHGLTTCVFQVLFFAKCIRRFGERGVFIGGMSSYLAIFALLPVISTVAQASGRTGIVWALLACLLLFALLADMCYGSVFMFLTASAPKSSRGSVNGLGQTSVSVARAIGPALSTSLFALSVDHNLLRGHAVYAIFFAISGGAVMLARRLPVEMWEVENE